MPFKLSKKYQKVAAELISKHRLPQYKKKKICNQCDGNGVRKIGINGCYFACHRCVNTLPVYKEWLIFCQDYPDLRKHYKKEL